MRTVTVKHYSSTLTHSLYANTHSYFMENCVVCKEPFVNNDGTGGKSHDYCERIAKERTRKNVCWVCGGMVSSVDQAIVWTIPTHEKCKPLT